jgi:hypothetical protein
MNICAAEKVVLKHHTLPTTWLLLDSCSTCQVWIYSMIFTKLIVQPWCDVMLEGYDWIIRAALVITPILCGTILMEWQTLF